MLLAAEFGKAVTTCEWRWRWCRDWWQRWIRSHRVAGTPERPARRGVL